MLASTLLLTTATLFTAGTLLLTTGTLLALAIALLCARCGILARAVQRAPQITQLRKQVTSIGLATLAAAGFRRCRSPRIFELLLQALQRIGGSAITCHCLRCAATLDVARALRQAAGCVVIPEILRSLRQLLGGTRRLLLGPAPRGIDLALQLLEFFHQLPPFRGQPLNILEAQAGIRVVLRAGVLAQGRAQVTLGTLLLLDQLTRRFSEVCDLLGAVLLLPPTLQLFARAIELLTGTRRGFAIATRLRLLHLFHGLGHLARGFCRRLLRGGLPTLLLAVLRAALLTALLTRLLP